MYYYIYAEKDATIYSDKTKDNHTMNTGMDEILELHKKVPPINDKIENSRILVKFNILKSGQYKKKSKRQYLTYEKLWK